MVLLHDQINVLSYLLQLDLYDGDPLVLGVRLGQQANIVPSSTH
jgi:hypothetical protein